MLKTIIYSLVSILVIGGIVYYFIKDKTVQNLTTQRENTIILLYVEEGDVLFKTPTDNAFKKATSSPTEIPNMTTVHTGNGKATVLFEDNSNISLDINTEITINHTKNKFNIFQSIGTTYHRVEKLLDGGSYEVTTPGTLAAVRGTKFAVRYQPENETTKVSVTENRVEVLDLRFKGEQQATATSSISNGRITAETNQTIEVRPVPNTSKDKPQIIRVIDTKNDPSMRTWIDTNKTRDMKLDSLKLESTSSIDLRTAMLRTLLDTSKVTTVRVATPIVKDTIIKKDPIVPVPIVPVVPKLTEEEFATKFDDMFIKYFYLDDIDTPCTIRLTASQKVAEVTKFAVDNGKPFTKSTLLSFGQAIDAYCLLKDPRTKTTLQTRFDVEYPY